MQLELLSGDQLLLEVLLGVLVSKATHWDTQDTESGLVEVCQFLCLGNHSGTRKAEAEDSSHLNGLGADAPVMPRGTEVSVFRQPCSRSLSCAAGSLRMQQHPLAML